MDYHRIKAIEFTRNYQNFDLCMMVKGPLIYKKIFEKAFQQCYFSRTFEDKYKKYNWGTYIKDAYPETTKNIELFAELLKKHIFLEDDLDECYALDYHIQSWNKRTDIGELVYKAKSYNKSTHKGDTNYANKLANMFVEFINIHPTLKKIKYIIAVPPSNPNKIYDLPIYLMGKIAEDTGKISLQDHIRKTRNTMQMKRCTSHEEKLENIMGSIEIDKYFFKRKNVIIIDDIYQTGISINEVGRVLKNGGASYVIGLTATKTLRD